MNRIIIVVLGLFSLPSITCPSRTDPKFEGSYSDLAETYGQLSKKMSKEISRVQGELSILGPFEQSDSGAEAFLARQAYSSKKSWLEDSERDLRGRFECYSSIAKQFSDLARYQELIKRELQGQRGLYLQILVARWQEFLQNKANLIPKLLTRVHGYFESSYKNLSRELPVSGEYALDAIRYGKAIIEQFAGPFANIDSLRELKSQWENHLRTKSSQIGQGATAELLELLNRSAARKERSIVGAETTGR